MIPSHTFFSPISHAGNKGTRSPRPSICLQLTARTRERRRTASSTTTIIHKKNAQTHQGAQAEQQQQQHQPTSPHLTSPHSSNGNSAPRSRTLSFHQSHSTYTQHSTRRNYDIGIRTSDGNGRVSALQITRTSRSTTRGSGVWERIGRIGKDGEPGDGSVGI